MKRKKSVHFKKSHKGTGRLKHYSYIIFYTFLSVFVALIVVGFFKNQDLPCANSETCIKDLSGKFEANQTEGVFLGKTVAVPQIVAYEDTPITSVLGDTSAKKLIKVDLSTQHVYAYEGNNLVMDFPVSTGKWYPTPTGVYHIWIKLRATRMAGGNPAIGTYYNLPNVQYTMYFYNNEIPKARGYALHGAYWHNNFGHPMSHGCVNISNENAEKLYNWASPPTAGYTTYATAENPGTEVLIYGETPNE